MTAELIDPAILFLNNIEALGEKIAATAEEAKASDPKILQQRIVQLERELAKPVESKVERVEVPVLSEEQISRIEAAYDKLTIGYMEWSEQLSQSVELSNAVIDQTTVLRRVLVDAGARAQDDLRAARQKTPPPARSTTPAPRPSGGVLTGDVGTLPKAARLVVAVLSQHGPCNRTKLALLAGYSSKGGGFNNALSMLRTNGLLEGSNDSLALTDAGMVAAPDVEPLPQGAELIEHWRSTLGGGAPRKVFDILLQEWPTQLTREQLADFAEYAPTGGGFNNAISKLRTLGLLVGTRDGMTVSDEFGAA